MSSHYIRMLFIAIISACISFFISEDIQAQPKDPMTGIQLSTVDFEPPENMAHQAYLGVSRQNPGDKTFDINDINADVVLVEIFSMYCPHCQKDAPNMNAFFNLIQKNELYRDRIKLIGIGVGNSAFEVDFFRKTYNIEFPLFPDPDFKIHKLLGGVRTPYFIGIKRLKNGSQTVDSSQKADSSQKVDSSQTVSDNSLKVFLSESGGERQPEVFLQQIIKQADLQ
ncbi:MAG: TlpA family protein disulfide reductase [Desulfamplus sp.]|nr:TlpA family protein disulfide reductase [Desulfamplus sp.]